MCITWKKKNTDEVNFIEKANKYFADFNNGRETSEYYKISDFDKAFNLLSLFKYKPVRIIGDYDTDGICSTSELNLMLLDLKFSDVKWYIPDRELDGYGASANIVEYLCNEISIHGLPVIKNYDTGLLITVDNGIAALDAITKAKELGWSVLILDHHLPVTDETNKKILPPADVIIDPHAVDCGAKFSDYCGAGLVYKFAQHIKQLNLPEWYIKDETIDKINGLAAIATVGDSVNLIENINGVYGYDNYLILKNGLFTLTQNSGRTTGMFCLLVGLKPDLETVVTTEDLAYLISPTINAISRLETFGSNQVVDLFLQNDNDFVTAIAKAKVLVEANERRKAYTNDLLPVLKQRIEEAHMENDYPIVICGKEGEIHPGVIGLIAGKLQEEYNTSVIVFAPINNGTAYKGSARAPEIEGANVNMKLLLDQVKQYMGNYGGHPYAAGISEVKAENMDKFIEAIHEAAGEKPKEFNYKYYDYDITVDQVKEEQEAFHNYIFGKGFEEPRYKISYMTELRKGVYYQLLGAEKKVLKLFNNQANAINFGGLVEKFEKLGEPTVLTLYGRLSENTWNGVTTPQIIFDDIDY